ncbi:hypothetical protein CHISP_3605 [Chitinispirillum alkaliphilum]|nr:hypothetical protein CHISP_3605 [Chitinispirillum alkaliphilum]
MATYNVVKVLANNGMVFPVSTIYRDVEIRPAGKDFEDEAKCLEESLEINKSNVDLSINSRISCIVEATTTEEAIKLADEKFEEVLDIKSHDSVLSQMELSNCGYTKDLITGLIKPILNHSFGPCCAFIRQLRSFHQVDSTQVFLLWNSELSERYKRSLHWSRNASKESNIQIQILFMWFAVEALFKETGTDMVAPYIRWFLGFPNGNGAQYIASHKRAQLRQNENYDKWKRKLIDALENIREFRNASVHSGFRRYDFSDNEILLYEHIMKLGTSRCQRAVYTAMASGLETVNEFKEYVGLIFDITVNVENDVHGTIIYTLENGINLNYSKQT